jgi:hypothetical protein
VQSHRLAAKWVRASLHLGRDKVDQEQALSVDGTEVGPT